MCHHPEPHWHRSVQPVLLKRKAARGPLLRRIVASCVFVAIAAAMSLLLQADDLLANNSRHVIAEDLCLAMPILSIRVSIENGIAAAWASWTLYNHCWPTRRSQTSLVTSPEVTRVSPSIPRVRPCSLRTSCSEFSRRFCRTGLQARGPYWPSSSPLQCDAECPCNVFPHLNHHISC